MTGSAFGVDPAEVLNVGGSFVDHGRAGSAVFGALQRAVTQADNSMGHAETSDAFEHLWRAWSPILSDLFPNLELLGGVLTQAGQQYRTADATVARRAF